MMEENNTNETAEKAKDLMGDLADKAKEMGGSAFDKTKELMGKAGEAIGDLKDKAEEKLNIDIDRDGKIGAGEAAPAEATEEA